jgi:predicted GH43/DUF377 family glycosyl hydrolase
MLERCEGNPILEPIEGHPWESSMVFNCAAIYEGGKVHIVYRGVGNDDVSKFGYASSSDGYRIDERLDEPVFEPEAGNAFEADGCEDPRLIKIDNKIFMTYTAVGLVPEVAVESWRAPKSIQIGLTSISLEGFLNHRWRWSERSYPLYRILNKDCLLFPEKLGGKYVMYHRIQPYIWVAYSYNLKDWFDHRIVMKPEQEWEYYKIGGGAPPIKTEKGWLLIYHGVDKNWYYRLGLAVVDLNDPQKTRYRHKSPILEPIEPYEKHGKVRDVTFTCGAVLLDDTIFVYYGAADTRVCVATMKLDDVLSLF